MTSKGRRLSILVVWAVALFPVIWFLVPRPPSGDEEYTEWLILGMLALGLRWFLDFLLVLPIAFSLEKRSGLTRLCILGAWTLVVAAAAWFDVIRPQIWDNATPFDRSEWRRTLLHIFAFPRLFGLLIALCIALWLEKRIATRPSPTS
jgi:H+/gluconate symporter-like permease